MSAQSDEFLDKRTYSAFIIHAAVLSLKPCF